MTKDNPISKDLLRVKPTPRKIKGPRDQKKLYVLMIFLIVALVSAVVVSLIFGHKASKSKTKTSIPTPPAKEEMKNENKNEEEIDTSDWLTYENKEYGYSVKYPKELNLKEEDPTKVHFISNADETYSEAPKGYNISIYAVKNPQNLSLEKWIAEEDKERAEHENNNPEKTKILEEKIITIDNLKAIKRIYEPPTEPTYTAIYLIQKETAYVIEYTVGIASTSETQQFNSIFNTFINNFDLK